VSILEFANVMDIVVDFAQKNKKGANAWMWYSQPMATIS
jgi:hypothetical protein